MFDSNEVVFKAPVHYGPSDLMGALDFFMVLGFTILSFWLYSLDSHFFKVPSILLFGICVFHWFSIVHSSGHGSQFKTKWLNDVSGLVASAFSTIPYFTWRRLHFLHHRWNGLQGKDPTVSVKSLEKLNPTIKVLVDFCWKYHLPVFSSVFVLQTFYNLPFAFRFAKNNKDKLLFIFSAVWIPLFHVCFGLYFGQTYVEPLLIGFFFYLFLSDPITLGQHCYLPLPEDFSEKRILNTKVQNSLTRTLSFSPFADRWIFAQFPNHTPHHLHPQIPHYFLHKIPCEIQHVENGWKWYIKSRKIRGSELVFSRPPP